MSKKMLRGRVKQTRVPRPGGKLTPSAHRGADAVGRGDLSVSLGDPGRSPGSTASAPTWCQQLWLRKLPCQTKAPPSLTLPFLPPSPRHKSLTAPRRQQPCSCWPVTLAGAFFCRSYFLLVDKDKNIYIYICIFLTP